MSYSLELCLQGCLKGFESVQGGWGLVKMSYRRLGGFCRVFTLVDEGVSRVHWCSMENRFLCGGLIGSV